MDIYYKLEKAAYDNGFQAGVEAALDAAINQIAKDMDMSGFSQQDLWRLRDDVKVSVLAQRAKREDD